MNNVTWFDLLAAAVSGGVVVKFLDILYAEYQAWSSKSKTTEEFVDSHLGPFLKAADELHGKLRSLAEQDFGSIQQVSEAGWTKNSDFSSLVYLFARFWSQIEILRQDGLSVTMGRSPRGIQLVSFLDCLESRRVRIIERILQRATGELAVAERQPMGFVPFIAGCESNEEMRRWISPLAHFLSRLEHTTERQTLLQYAVVVHAMIDTLDPKHLVTRDRPGLPKKLTTRTWGELNYRVFRVYLKFVTSPQKYIGPPPKAARLKKGRQREGTLEPPKER